MRFMTALIAFCLFLTPLYGQRKFFPKLTQQKNAKQCLLTPNEVARQLDGLQQMIENYGSIVPKQPDVWGEARLTKHRHQVEVELAKNLGAFRETLNGSLRRSDQSYLSTALAITAATGDGVRAPNLDRIRQQVEDPDFQRTDSGKLTNAANTASLHDSRIDGLSLEPTVALQQNLRYLNLLNELRRINEGDDTSDSPGYSLNLMRLPSFHLAGNPNDIRLRS